MHKFTSKTLGRLSLAIGFLIAVAAVFLLIFFISYFNDIEWLYIFGPSTDVLNLTTSILTCVMAVILLPPPRKQPVLFIAFLILVAAACVGAAIVTVYSLREGVLMPDNIYNTLRHKYGLVFITDNNGLFGQGLIGLWLTAVNIYAYMKKFWPRSTAILGVVPGLIQSLGLFNLSVGYVGVASQLVWNFLLSRWILVKKANTTRTLGSGLTPKERIFLPPE